MLDTGYPTLSRQQIEAQLLDELRSAEAAFKAAPASHKQAAEEHFRKALRRFSELVLDSRMPAGINVRP